MSQPNVGLRALTRTDLAAIAPWFDDPDTRRYLGGPAWPATMLDLGSIAFVTDPRIRGRGIGRTLITAMLARSELDRVELFEAGVEPANVGCRRCLEAAGFRVRSPEPDCEAMLYYRADRPGRGSDAPPAEPTCAGQG
jgi:RimJ/RimL family protein N-acetyltransferase